MSTDGQDRDRAAQRWLKMEASSLALQIPATTLDGLAEKLRALQPHARARKAQTLLSELQQPSTRDRVRVFFQVWARSYPSLRPPDIALALEVAAAATTRTEQRQQVELVWTGPRPEGPPLRRTDEVLLELIETAQKRLLIVTYAAYKIERLKDALLEASARGVEIVLVLESKEDSLGAVTVNPLKALGPKLEKTAEVYVWPLKERTKSPQGKHGSLHAKCAVADGRVLLVSSANLTQHALTINMELGVCIREGSEAAEVDKHFRAMIAAGTLQRDS